MKNALLISLFYLLVSLSVFAQYGTIVPDGFIVPNATTAPGCSVAERGKMYYNSTAKLLMVCDGTEWISTISQWKDNVLAPGTINTSRKVGINTTTPQYPLDVSGAMRITGYLLAPAMGIGWWAMEAIQGLELLLQLTIN